MASDMFCDLLGNKAVPQMGKEEHLRAYDSMCIILIDTYLFSLIKSLHSLKIQMWFYHHKNIIFFVPFAWNK